MSKKSKSRAAQFPFPVLAVLAYLLMGFVWDLWHPGWLVFLTIPVYYYTVTLIESINKDDGKGFWRLIPYPLFCTVAYICMGAFWGLWHPGWLIFLTIPIWSFFVSGEKKAKDEDVMDYDDL